jgi:hypothetical protein
VHVQIMHASMRGSVHIVSRHAGRLLDTGFSACLHNCTIIRRMCCAGRLLSGETENGMSRALGFLATCRKYNQGVRARDLLGLRGG